MMATKKQIQTAKREYHAARRERRRRERRCFWTWPWGHVWPNSTVCQVCGKVAASD